MKTYHCSCGQLIFFHNISCVNCGRELGFLPDRLTLVDLGPAENGAFRPNEPSVASAVGVPGALYKKCQNYADQSVCNWMIAADEAEEAFCISCRLNEVIPDLTVAGNREHWALIEGAKRRLVYSLIRVNLPVVNKIRDPQNGLSFRFLADGAGSGEDPQKVLTGHDDGTITLNIDEANDSVRERMRHSMNEPYRTLLGHFRHESGHYYWDCLVAGSNFLERFRALFGDERPDYAQALETHYSAGAPANWQASYISAYATAHPWEDWAETWAHFLHFHDTMEVAGDFGLVGKKWRLDRSSQPGRSPSAPVPSASDFEGFIRAWSQLTIALNSISRSMGLQDLYPFVLSTPVIEKLRFVSEVIAAGSATRPARVGAAQRAMSPAAAPGPVA
jgi:hypothetical protein